MARELGGAAYTRLSHTFIGAQVREGAFLFQKMWNMDKVFRLSTAGNVSFDELLRIWAKAGTESFGRWMQMRVDFLRARAAAALHGEKFYHEGVSRGAKYLSPKAQERIRSVQDFPTYLKQAERQYYEGNGLG